MVKFEHAMNGALNRNEKYVDERRGLVMSKDKDGLLSFFDNEGIPTSVQKIIKRDLDADWKLVEQTKKKTDTFDKEINELDSVVLGKVLNARTLSKIMLFALEQFENGKRYKDIKVE